MAETTAEWTDALTEQDKRDLYASRCDGQDPGVLDVAARIVQEHVVAAVKQAQADALAAVEALAEEATQRAYMQISTGKVLTVMTVPGDAGRAFVPGHWRTEAEEAASVSVADLRAAIARGADL